MSYYKGMEYGKKIYLENILKYGFSERSHSEKIIKTCNEYAKNEKIKRTKKGVKLTKEKRLFYKGIADYLIAPKRVRF